MQVASRILLVWPICYRYPTVATSPAYSSMLLAWSMTEVVRYTYFVFALRGGGVPGVLQWLRYNLFYVLYPLGISSECWQILKAIKPASQEDERFGYALWAVLAIYVPGESATPNFSVQARRVCGLTLVAGSYILYTHMMAQRRKATRGARKTQ
jgi:very-long-chain (3R)-3-hydroxyacyl-CoA dehydratase